MEARDVRIGMKVRCASREHAYTMGWNTAAACWGKTGTVDVVLAPTLFRIALDDGTHTNLSAAGFDPTEVEMKDLMNWIKKERYG